MALSNIGNLLYQYGTSLDETRKLLADMSSQMQKALNGKLPRPEGESRMPQYLSASRASEYGLDVPAGWGVKVLPVTDPEGNPHFHLVRPDQWEVADTGEYISPTGQRMTEHEYMQSAAGIEEAMQQLAAALAVDESMPVPERIRAEQMASEFLDAMKQAGRTPEIEQVLSSVFGASAAQIDEMFGTEAQPVVPSVIDPAAPATPVERALMAASPVPQQPSPEEVIAYQTKKDQLPPTTYWGDVDWDKPLAQAQLYWYSGVGDLLRGFASIFNWKGMEDAGARLNKLASNPVFAERERVVQSQGWRTAFDPRYWTTELPRMMPFTIMASAISTAFTAGLGTAPTFAVLVLRSLLGTGVATVWEAGVEAAQTYEQGMAKWDDHDKADAAANEVFKRNVALLATSNWGQMVVGLGGRFLPGAGNPFLSFSGRMSVEMVTQAGEEVTQEVFNRLALGEDVKFDYQMQECAVAGGLLAVPFTVGLEAVSRMQEYTKQNLTEDQHRQLEKDIEEGVVAGLSPEEATQQAFENLAQTEAGREAIQDAVDEVKQEETEKEAARLRNKPWEVPASEEIIADAFASNFWKRKVQELSTIPGFKKAVQTMLGVRETTVLESKVIEDIIARDSILWLEIQKRGRNLAAAMVWKLRAVSSKPRELFGFNERAFSQDMKNALLPEYNHEMQDAGTLEHVFVHPEMYNLTDQQLRYVTEVHRVFDKLLELEKTEGVAPKDLKTGWYIHRVVMGQWSEGGEFMPSGKMRKGRGLSARELPERQRKAGSEWKTGMSAAKATEYRTMAEGIADGMAYANNPEDAVSTAIMDAYKAIADVRFAKQIKDFGEKPQERMARLHPKLAEQLKLSAEEHEKVNKFLGMVKFVQDGGRPTDAQLVAMEQAFPQWTMRLRAMLPTNAEVTTRTAEYIRRLKTERDTLAQAAQSAIEEGQSLRAALQKLDQERKEARPKGNLLLDAFTAMHPEERAGFRDTLESQVTAYQEAIEQVEAAGQGEDGADAVKRLRRNLKQVEKMLHLLDKAEKKVEAFARDIEGVTDDIEDIVFEGEQDEPSYPATEDDKVSAVAAMGKQTLAYDPNSRMHYMQMAVVEMDDLLVSHTAGYAENPDYPQELQPRNRNRQDYKNQVQDIANPKKFVPSRLLRDTREVTIGPPIVGKDLVVESGNGRVMALRLMRSSYKDSSYAAYRDSLAMAAEAYAIPAQELAKYKHPVLVRIRTSGVKDRSAFCRLCNSRETRAASPFEIAQQDALRISAEAVARLEVAEEEDIDDALRKVVNLPIMREFASSLSDNERSDISDSKGQFNATAYERVKWALLAKTYTGAAGERLVEAFKESAVEEIKNVRDALFGSLPQLAPAEALVQAGVRSEDISVAPMLANAIGVYARCKREGMPIADYLKQMAAFGDELTAVEKEVLAFIDKNASQRTALRMFVKDLAERIQYAPPPGQGLMFGGEETTLESMVAFALEKRKSRAREAVDPKQLAKLTPNTIANRFEQELVSLEKATKALEIKEREASEANDTVALDKIAKARKRIEKAQSMQGKPQQPPQVSEPIAGYNADKEPWQVIKTERGDRETRAGVTQPKPQVSGRWTMHEPGIERGGVGTVVASTESDVEGKPDVEIVQRIDETRSKHRPDIIASKRLVYWLREAGEHGSWVYDSFTGQRDFDTIEQAQLAWERMEREPWWYRSEATADDAMEFVLSLKDGPCATVNGRSILEMTRDEFIAAMPSGRDLVESRTREEIREKLDIIFGEYDEDADFRGELPATVESYVANGAMQFAGHEMGVEEGSIEADAIERNLEEVEGGLRTDLELIWDLYHAREQLRKGEATPEPPAPAPEIPKAMPGQPEAGLQTDLFGYARPYYPKGRSKLTQISMDDYAKLCAYRNQGSAPPNVGIQPPVWTEDDPPVPPPGRLFEAQARIVRQALREDQAVSAEGLQDYPMLVQRYGYTVQEEPRAYKTDDDFIPRQATVTPEQRTQNLKALAKDVSEVERTRSQSVGKLQKQADRALEKVKAPGLRQGYLAEPVFGGRIYDQEFISAVNEFFDNEKGRQELTFAADLAGIMRISKAAADVSWPAIQGMPSWGFAHRQLLTNPKLGIKLMAGWHKAFAYGVRGFLDMEFAGRYVAAEEGSIAQRIQFGGSTQSVDYFDALHVKYHGRKGVGALGERVLTKVPGHVFERGETAFFIASEVVRNEFWKAMSPEAIERGEAFDCARMLDRMTGVIDTKSMGIGLTVRQLEQSFGWFAARYTRACCSLLAHTFRGGYSGKVARQSMAGMIAAGAMYYTAVQFALSLLNGDDEEKAWRNVEEGFGITKDPITGEMSWYPTAAFMSIKVGNHYLGIGGFWYGMVRLFGHVCSCVNESNGHQRVDLYRLWDAGLNRDNPFINWWYNRSSPLVGMFKELKDDRTYLGYPLETRWEYAFYIASKFVPIWVEQSVFPYLTMPLKDYLPNVAESYDTPEGWAKALVPVAEMTGWRTFPESKWAEHYKMVSEQLGSLPDQWFSEYYTGPELQDILRARDEGTLTWHQLTDRAQHDLLKMYPKLQASREEALAASAVRDTPAWKAYERRLDEERRIRNSVISNATQDWRLGLIDSREWDSRCDHAEDLYYKGLDCMRSEPAYSEVFEYWERQDEQGNVYSWEDNVALAEFYGLSAGLYDGRTDTMDFEEYDRRVAAFIAKWGQERYEQYLQMKWDARRESGINEVRVRQAQDVEALSRNYWDLPYKRIGSMDDEDFADGAIPTQYVHLWKTYQGLASDEERDAFLEQHPELDRDYRAEWRAEHPEDDARLKLWGYGGDLQTKEAYDILMTWAKELGLGDNALMKLHIPPRNLAEPFFGYKEVQREHGGNSLEAKWYRLEHPAFAEWGQDTYGWKSLDPDDVMTRELYDLVTQYNELDQGKPRLAFRHEHPELEQYFVDRGYTPVGDRWMD